ncbi:ubiquinol-cytochrome c reductase cytochrome b subunit [Nocardioides sp. zg-536]|uniref:Cytochrome bc1 complex cytochrome b subunit n=1 Tax=Nocardioides faecalis TaxID=2803858 RepID=A0A938Y8Y8_9ACTN|nr:ubiquinol-cytochrome c reductase cytochrome b subunit [Nocardioides faecalis]MBM9461377.1 ubiquinol-cytochrome c reductase cytochrome b subunit [Nocardioides faecalis]MBS4752342.1 ubiquinol-cytochrome c reductase cytochrome b subunit [Nocardioides faecalis]QVI57643.1 ubiquinol-cytochrome c reductase cytochrome b subunit [Nocardioides faecalis]
MSVDLNKVASTNGSEPAAANGTTRGGAIANWADERLGLGSVMKKNLRKVFPDHWSFMLGEIALWSFVVVLLTGVFLTLWFDPSMAEVNYNGSYDPLRGVHMSAAMASTLEISFDVRGGLLMRQMHHWGAMIFIGSMMVHLMRVYFTGAFRKPRELNWVIGCLLLLLGTIEGFTGYSLPDDLLSGTGVRAADGFMKATPVVGTYMSFFLFGGEFPGDSIIPRFYAMHILLIPGILLALVAAHMLLLVYHKHTQWPGPGRTEENVVGYPMLPVYAAKAGGFFFIVFGVIALFGGLFSLNPVWKYGPYDPSKVTAGSQPDWYMGWPDGLLRIIPAWETHLWGFTVSWNVMIPILVAPPLLLMVLILLPFLESWITGDKREHHLLQRPRNAPTRTAIMVALMTFYGLSWAAGGNDIIAIKMHLSINQITYFLRAAVFVGPVIAFIITRRWCISLQRADEAKLLHGYESGVLVRSPEGAYAEKHLPLPLEEAYALTARDDDPKPESIEEIEASGLKGKKLRRRKLRARLQALFFADNVQKPTAAELEEAQHHSEHELHELEDQISAGPNRHGPAEH